MGKLATVRLFVAALCLLSVPSTNAEAAWKYFSSGDGTAFEKRWVGTNAIVSMSSDETLASDMPLAAALWKDGGLFVFVSHTSSEICEFSDWELAVDKSLIAVESELAEDTKQTHLFPVDSAESRKLLTLFGDGNRIAVQFHAKCDNMFYSKYVGTVTLTYSLEGSKAALRFLRGVENSFGDTRD